MIIFIVALIALVVTHTLATRLLILLFYRLTGRLNVAMLLYAMLVWPGTVLHEVAHWLVAWLLGVRSSLPRLLPSPPDGSGGMVLGHVMIERADPLRRSLIGVAPLVAGSAAVVLLARHAFALPLPLVEAEGLAGLLPLLRALPSIFDVPDVWLWLYGIFTVANAMLPSASDREAWPTLLLFTGLIALALALLGVAPSVPPTVTQAGLRLVGWLTFAFVLTAVLDAALVLLLFPVERLLWWLRGGR